MIQSTLKLRTLCAILGLSASSLVLAHEMEMPAQCKAHARLEFPAADLPGPRDMRGLIACDAPGSYFGVQSPVDFVKARHCAFTQPAATFQGSGILAMLYANGQGVTRDYGLAGKAACSASEDPHEVAEILNKLARAEKEQGELDICENVWGESLTAGCLLVEANQRAEVRSARMAAITATWPAEHTAALNGLLENLAKFADTRAKSEVVNGAHQGARTILGIAQVDDKFLALIEQAEANRLTPVTQARLRALERELKAIGVQVLAAAKATPQAGLKQEGLRESYTAWQEYQDAWEKFSKVRYPKVSPATARGNLTTWRIAELQRLAKEMRTGAPIPGK